MELLQMIVALGDFTTYALQWRLLSSIDRFIDLNQAKLQIERLGRIYYFRPANPSY